MCAVSLPIWITLTSFFCPPCAAYQTHKPSLPSTKEDPQIDLIARSVAKAMTKNTIITLHMENVKSETDQFVETDRSVCKPVLSGTISLMRKEKCLVLKKLQEIPLVLNV